MLGDGLARRRLVVDRQRDHADVGLGEPVGGALECAQLGGAVGAPAAAIEQDDAKVADERTGQLQRPPSTGVIVSDGKASPGMSLAMKLSAPADGVARSSATSQISPVASPSRRSCGRRAPPVARRSVRRSRPAQRRRLSAQSRLDTPQLGRVRRDCLGVPPPGIRWSRRWRPKARRAARGGGRRPAERWRSSSVRG